MDTNALINLIETVSKTLNTEGFEHMELMHEGTTLVLNKQSISQAAPAQMVSFPQPASAPVQTEQPVQTATAEPISQETSEPTAVDGNFKTIDSPIVGTYYNAPTPEADTFVKIGDQVKKGDVVCIIEAMKLMNEIESECDGEIVEILVANEGPVEYGQVLFKLK